MNNDPSGKKIAIEDLLSLKRAERPAPEFWGRFEKELRAKQLAAIVQKPVWWSGLASLFGRAAKLHLPLGATAILAVSVVVVHEYRGSPSVRESVLSAAETSEISATAVVENPAVLSRVPSNFAASEFNSLVSPALTVGLSQESAPTPVPEVIAMRGTSSQKDQMTGVSYPSSQAIIASNLQQAQVERADDIMTMSGTSSFESRILPSRPSLTEPLAQLATPKSVRLHDRYLGAGISSGYSFDSSGIPAASHGSERLREREFHPDEFSRFDAHGDRLSIKL